MIVDAYASDHWAWHIKIIEPRPWFASEALPRASMPQGGTVSTSSPIVLASGAITRSGDQLLVELIQPDSLPAVVRISWPAIPSVTQPTPKALAALAAAMVRCMAEAQTELAAKIRNSR